MKTGDIAFVHTTGIFPSLIRFFDKGRFNHVCLFVSDTKIVEADYNIKVQEINFPYTDYEVISLNLTEEEKARVVEEANKFIGEEYDFIQIFRIWFRLVFGWKGLDKFNNPKEVICSELVADILQSIGKAEKGTEELAPNELYKYLKNKGY